MSIAAVDVDRDDELVGRAAEGDQDAFGALYLRYSQGIYDFAARTVRDRDLASDVVQTTFTRAWEAIQKGTRPQNIKAWLYTIARNDAIDHVRRSQRIVFDSGEDGVSLLDTRADPGRGPEEVLYDEELASLVWRAAAGLNPRQYSLLDLHLRQQLSADELAESLGLRRDNVYVMLSRLRESLEESVSLLLLMQRGRRECGELDALLTQRSVFELTRESRRLVRKHLDTCPRCQELARRYISPAEIFAGMAVLPVSLESSMGMWEQIAPHLVPLPAPPAPLPSPINPMAPVSPGPLPPVGGPVPPPPIPMALPAPPTAVPPGLEGGLWLAPSALLAKIGLVAGGTVASVALVTAVVLTTIEGAPMAAIGDPVDVHSTSHVVGEPSFLNVIEIHWSPVLEAAGYSVMWSGIARDLPDTRADLIGDAVGASSGPLPPGIWYFHLRTAGQGGEWTSTVHAGPFIIVARADEAPSPAALEPDPSAARVASTSTAVEVDEATDDGQTTVVVADLPEDEVAVFEVAVPASPTPTATATATPVLTPTMTPATPASVASGLDVPTSTVDVSGPVKTLPSTAAPRATLPRPPSIAAPTSQVASAPSPQPTTVPTQPSLPTPEQPEAPTPVVVATQPASEPAIPTPLSTVSPPEPPSSSSAAGPSPALPTVETRPPTRMPSRTPTSTGVPTRAATAVQVSTATPTRSPLPCASLAITTFAAAPQTERVLVTWEVSGGCPPYGGTITASVVGEGSYRVHPITGASGSLPDTPPRCPVTVEYRLTLSDSMGRQVTGAASVDYSRGCG